MDASWVSPCADPSDVLWLDLRRSLWPGASDAKHLREMRVWAADGQRYGCLMFIAPDGAALGFAEVSLRHDHVNGTESSPVAFLEGLYVRPEARRRGVARALVARVERWARERGCSELGSDTPLGNSASQAMHSALGFDETERVVMYRRRLGTR